MNDNAFAALTAGIIILMMVAFCLIAEKIRSSVEADKRFSKESYNNYNISWRDRKDEKTISKN